MGYDVLTVHLGLLFLNFLSLDFFLDFLFCCYSRTCLFSSVLCGLFYTLILKAPLLDFHIEGGRLLLSYFITSRISDNRTVPRYCLRYRRRIKRVGCWFFELAVIRDYFDDH